MPKFYCFNCGAGTDYTLNKPKVCLKCNQSFVTISVKKSDHVKVSTDTIKDSEQSLASHLKGEKKKVTPVTQNSILIEDGDGLALEDIPKIDFSSFAAVEAQRNCSSLSYSQLLKEGKEKKSKVTKTTKVKNKTKKS